MRIGIDIRMAGTGEGIGRYVEELVKNLAKIDSENQYFLLFQREFPISNFQFPNFKAAEVKSPYYSWAEQTRFIWELKKLKLDLVHFPNFNAPIFYPGKFIITIHDIIHHQFPGKKKSRFFHRLAYRATIRAAIRNSRKIIAVSQATKKDIIETFGVNEEKVVVIYEGVGEKFFQKTEGPKIEEVKRKYDISKPYLLFVGVWRQYKNLERLASAFDILKERYRQGIQLVLVGKIDPFYPEIKQAVMSEKFAKDIKALGFVSEEDLKALYQGTRAFVLPSLIEGFGLIGVEAQASGVPVVASDIPVLREVLGSGALFVDPNDEKDMTEKIHQILSDADLTRELKQKGQINARRFTWEETAKKTLEVYKTV